MPPKSKKSNKYSNFCIFIGQNLLYNEIVSLSIDKFFTAQKSGLKEG
jgi:hypothetical protein